MLDADGRTLRDALSDLIRRGGAATVGDAAFDDLARRIFAYQYQRVPAYGAYCRARGATPASLGDWRGIPAVPTAAFKALTLLPAGASAEVVFRTSGTTRGAGERGAHHVADADLYRASLRATFHAYLLPDGAHLRFLSLMPAPAELPDSSLAFMIDDVVRTFGAAGSGTLAGADGLDFDGLEAAVAAAIAEGAPVLLLGTSAAFIHWLDRLEAADTSHALPDGSRLMDTGGFKGAGREVPAAALRRVYTRRLGIPGHACVNEYGMTEMLSQMYDRRLRDRVRGDRTEAGAAASRKRGPGWLRSVAVDPDTLEPLPAGETGLLRHVDLANLGSLMAVQTEDVGRVDDRGLVLDGRARGAEPRGCSIAMDTLLRSKT